MRFCKESRETFCQFGAPATRWFAGAHVSAVSCTKCGYVGFDPPDDATLAHYYSNVYGSAAKQWYSLEADYASAKAGARADHVLRLLATYRIPAGAVVLELGCAYGGTVHELRQRGIAAYGVDLNADAIKEGRGHGNRYVFNDKADALLKSLHIQPSLVYSYHTLEHVPDPALLLAGLRPHLGENAVLEFRVPNGAYVRALVEGFERWEWFAFPDHLHMFSPRSVLCLAERAGYELIDVSAELCGEAEESLVELLAVGAPGNDGPVHDFLRRNLLFKELQFRMCVAGSPASFRFRHAADLARSRCLEHAAVERRLKELAKAAAGVGGPNGPEGFEKFLRR